MIENVSTFFNNLIYDGLEESTYSVDPALSSNMLSEIKISNYNYFNKISEEIKPRDIAVLLSFLPNIKPNKLFPEVLMGSQNLPLRYYYDKKKNLIYLISFGESQPARYKIYLEGIFRVLS